MKSTAEAKGRLAVAAFVAVLLVGFGLLSMLGAHQEAGMRAAAPLPTHSPIIQ